MKICVFGLGYVGTVSCGCLAELGHTVIGVDVDAAKVDLINRGQSPITEEGLPQRIRTAVDRLLLRATCDPAEAVQESELAMICVGTPSTPSGGVNAVHLETVCSEIAHAVKQHNPKGFVVANRSTALPPIHRRLMTVLEESSGRRIGETMGYVCHPEFLREGSAVADFYEPPKIVFGTSDDRTRSLCKRLYPGIESTTFFVEPDIAAMVKYADNCFHAVKVTFGNEIGMICRTMGVDSQAVMDLFCADRKLNISDRYLRPGGAFGGSCLPKDLRAIIDTARKYASPLPMLNGTLKSNHVQIEQVVKRIISPERPHVGIVGLAFKGGTDDVREAPAVGIVEQLCGKGHVVHIFDATLSSDSLIGANRQFVLQAIPHLAELLLPSLVDVVEKSDVVLVNHQLSCEQWSKVSWRSNQRIIDIANTPSLYDLPNYEGLYWQGTNKADESALQKP